MKNFLFILLFASGLLALIPTDSKAVTVVVGGKFLILDFAEKPSPWLTPAFPDRRVTPEYSLCSGQYLISPDVIELAENRRQ